jgi:hypothetical protein
MRGASPLLGIARTQRQRLHKAVEAMIRETEAGDKR